MIIVAPIEVSTVYGSCRWPPNVPVLSGQVTTQRRIGSAGTIMPASINLTPIGFIILSHPTLCFSSDNRTDVT